MTPSDIIEKIIETEGGYVDDPNDLGGATNWGITEKVAREHGYTGDMRDLPRETAASIYSSTYYIKPGYARVGIHSPKIAYVLTDMGVNMGPGVASRFLQRSLNVLSRQGRDYDPPVADGAIGPKTLAALEAYLDRRGKQGVTVLSRALNCLQGARYIEISESRPENQAFTFGWLANRVSL